jgi:hypothetical protein
MTTREIDMDIYLCHIEHCYKTYFLSISLWNAFTHANRTCLLIISGDHRDANPIRVLISRIFDLENL